MMKNFVNYRIMIHHRKMDILGSKLILKKQDKNTLYYLINNPLSNSIYPKNTIITKILKIAQGKLITVNKIQKKI